MGGTRPQADRHGRLRHRRPLDSWAATSAAQVKAALGEADGALFVVDGRAGPLPGDYEIADVLRRAKIPTLLVANKVDDPRHEAELVAFYELGLGEPLAVSALHGTGSGDLLDELVALAARLAGDRPGDDDAGRGARPRGRDRRWPSSGVPTPASRRC